MALQLPIIDLSSTDLTSNAESIRQACLDCGFFYIVNHGVDLNLMQRMFEESSKFFSLPRDQKMKLARKEHRGYTPLYAENLDYASSPKGDSKESFYIGPLEGDLSNLNQWPPEGIIHIFLEYGLIDILLSWRPTMESYYKQVLTAGKRLLSLVALSLRLEENFFVKIGALDDPMPFLRLLHYPGELESSNEEVYGASAHSDYGMITLLATNGVCRDKLKKPRVWENVLHIDGALIVNIGDMMERWTNCLYRSTLHRVMPTGQERHSAAFFMDPNPDCVVECLKSCCSESSPPRFTPIRSEDYLKERFRLTYTT
ncbi:Isopenicillin N synthase-like, Fe(2+) 2OG dioxygenase domain [Dillenia turbinata]|uniref:Isopenicillin N synthase-like, Fe(2+) 2OG dioxygenase domain n=1 Tax=Dillenia turbinata TaxID=194707 RepID=A0AAN8ZI43_9MAGN